VLAGFLGPWPVRLAPRIHPGSPSVAAWPASELVASMGTVGDALDNAVAEGFFATLECELLDRYS
jgi:hypothetical protein